MALPLTLTPVTLTGTHAILVPLAPEHAPALADAARDGELWKLWYTTVPAPDSMAREIDRRLGLLAANSMLPFTVIDATGRPAGMTTYMNIDNAHQRVEIGSTWYAARVQRSPLNTEAKLLLLRHAFEVWSVGRVAICTDARNDRSRRAIERIGATLEGVLRNHRPSAGHHTAAGTLRDTAVYSIIDSEWPTVRAQLQQRLS